MFLFSRTDSIELSPFIIIIIQSTLFTLFNIQSVLHNNEEVAIKKFHGFNDSVKQRFIKELNIVSKLQHRNLVKHLGHFYQNDETLVHKGGDFVVHKKHHLVFVSEYISNQSLIKVIKGTFPLKSSLITIPRTVHQISLIYSL